MMPPDLEILELLRRHGVTFTVIGGHAVNVHGFRRATDDVDVVWVRSAASEELLLAALTEAGAEYIGDDIDPATGIERAYPVTRPFVQRSHLMMLVTKLGFLDLFDYVPGLPDAEPKDLLATAIDVNGLKFVSLHWLRELKRASGRAKDLEDLKNLPEH